MKFTLFGLFNHLLSKMFRQYQFCSKNLVPVLPKKFLGLGLGLGKNIFRFWVYVLGLGINVFGLWVWV
jgi:hypothetical protein